MNGFLRSLASPSPVRPSRRIPIGRLPVVDASEQAGQEESWRTVLWPVLGVALQLGLVLLVVREFQIESRTFFAVMALAAGGFLVHALLPLRYRLPFFTALSIVSVGIALGVRDALSVIAIGLGLIAICHLPIRYGARVVLLLAAAGLLAAARTDWLPTPVSPSIWAVLGSIFMFRLALYLYALGHDGERPTLVRTLAYFFMLPNACFPLFPVVDYNAFCRTHYDGDAIPIYQTGMRWITRGLVHLVLYRFVYLHLLPDPSGLSDLGDVVRYVLATFLLYLRVSGQFHLIVGVLHLFGFRLPETHHLYYLASSFNDFWRRINIYWKDFMMKLVYYPSFFRLRRYGNTAALVGATVAVFVATWLLHSYQWFWLRGGFPVTGPDVLFWGILGGLVVANALRETKRGRRRTRSEPSRWSASRALRTVGTFSVICLLWSLWSADTVGDWLGLWLVAGRVEASDLLLLGALLAGGLAIAGYAWDAGRVAPDGARAIPRRPTVQVVATLLLLVAIGQTGLYDGRQPRVAALVASLKQSTLNASDAARQHRGYYEQLDSPGRSNAKLWDVRVHKPADWATIADAGAWRKRDDFLASELRPSTRVRFNGQTLSVNSQGMRDRDYERTKAPGTLRVALVGPSYVMGLGIADGETFDNLLEDRLTRDLRGGRYQRVEVLNFGVPGYALVQEATILDDRVWDFEPDVVIVTMPERTTLRNFMAKDLRRVLWDEAEIPYPDLEALLRESGVVSPGRAGLPIPFEWPRRVAERLGIPTRLPWWEFERRIDLSVDAVTDWSLRHAAQASLAHDAVPILMALDVVPGRPGEPVPGRAVAEDAGFLVWNLFDVYEGHDPDSLRVAPWDDHPNARGSRLISDRLYTEFQREAGRFGLDLPAPPTATVPPR